MKAVAGFKIARIAAIILLLWALDRHPYGYRSKGDVVESLHFIV